MKHWQRHYSQSFLAFTPLLFILGTKLLYRHCLLYVTLLRKSIEHSTIKSEIYQMAKPFPLMLIWHFDFISLYSFSWEAKFLTFITCFAYSFFFMPHLQHLFLFLLFLRQIYALSFFWLNGYWNEIYNLDGWNTDKDFYFQNQHSAYICCK